MTPHQISELRSLAMRPGRRRVVERLIAAGENGAAMIELTAAYNGCDLSDRVAMKRSAACDLGRLRSQVGRLGFVLTSTRHRGREPGKFILSRPEPEPVRAVEVGGVERQSRAEVEFGIRAAIGWGGVSVARCAFLEGAAG